ncbi:LytTR family transcriptional regulator DNA-binding domain-containing protein [Enterococcus ratti]|uniref:LytTR family transcriptional regulator DNA-binding domain-containing protein n=1 Tax=Enterococcus ratti TaxID=150033 RepID=UPI003CCBCE27
MNHLPENFIKTSSSDIVNVDKIKEVGYKLGKISFLNSSETAYVSRTYKKVLKTKLSIFN